MNVIEGLRTIRQRLVDNEADDATDDGPAGVPAKVGG